MIFFSDRKRRADADTPEHALHAAYVIKSASGTAARVSQPIGAEKLSKLVDPDVIKDSAEARRRAGVGQTSNGSL